MNTLVLFQLLFHTAIQQYDEETMVNDLIHIGLRMGFSKEEIHEALKSDRGLVIYEP